MGLIDNIKSFVFTDENEEEDTSSNVVKVTNNGVADNPNWKNTECEISSNIWQYNYALSVVKNILSAFLSNVEWKTYNEKEKIKGEEWFRFNIAPNNKDTAPEFYDKLAHKLVYDHQALIIETANKELFIADSYSFKDGEELLMKDNTFTNVKIGNVTLNRTFKENDSCMFIKAFLKAEEEKSLKSMASDFKELKKLIAEGADKALGAKYSLNLSAQGKNRYDEKTIRSIQNIYEPLMKKRNGVFITYKGETLTDLTERQRGSEVQQVLDAVENNSKVNNEILCNVGAAYGIPKKVMSGDYTSDNQDVYAMAMTMFAKPIFTLLSKKFTYFVLTKEAILKGSKVEADLGSIKFADSLSLASAIDKCIGSGAYTINEIREKVGDDTVEDGDTRFITKNYAVLSEYVKGEE